MGLMYNKCKGDVLSMEKGKFFKSAIRTVCQVLHSVTYFQATSVLMGLGDVIVYYFQMPPSIRNDRTE